MPYFRKRGCICPNKKKCKCDATWSFTVDIGVDPVTGKRKQKTVSGFALKRDAELACAELLTEIDRGNISPNAKNETLGGFIQNYLTNILVHEIEETTMDGKWSVFRTHIEPELGGKVIQKLTPADLQVFYNNLINKGMGPGGIQNVSRLLNQALQLALEWGYVSKNVNKLVKKPTYKQSKITVWNKEQFDQFLADSKDSLMYPYYMIALYGGLRPGEIFATTWDHIDFEKRTIRVDSTAARTKSKGQYIKPSPKNHSSNRIVSLPSHVIQFLKKHKLQQVPNELNLVIPGIASPIMWANTASDYFKEDLSRSQVPAITLHDLRHTHATYLLSPPPYGLGVSVKAVSERLGHSKTTTTLDTYFSVLPNMQEGIAEQFDKLYTKTVDK